MLEKIASADHNLRCSLEYCLSPPPKKKKKKPLNLDNKKAIENKYTRKAEYVNISNNFQVTLSFYSQFRLLHNF